MSLITIILITNHWSFDANQFDCRHLNKIICLFHDGCLFAVAGLNKTDFKVFGKWLVSMTLILDHGI